MSLNNSSCQYQLWTFNFPQKQPGGQQAVETCQQQDTLQPQLLKTGRENGPLPKVYIHKLGLK